MVCVAVWHATSISGRQENLVLAPIRRRLSTIRLRQSDAFLEPSLSLTQQPMLSGKWLSFRIHVAHDGCGCGIKVGRRRIESGVPVEQAEEPCQVLMQQTLKFAKYPSPPPERIAFKVPLIWSIFS